MVSMTSIIGFASGMKTAADITKALIDLKVTGEVQAKIVELQSIIMSAQSSALEAQQEQFGFQRRIEDLENEINRLKEIGEEKINYEIKQVDPGCFAYMLKLEFRKNELPMWFCIPCFDNGYKRVLQSTGENSSSRLRYTCTSCSGFFAVRPRVSPNWLHY
jgi:ribosomal protein S6